MSVLVSCLIVFGVLVTSAISGVVGMVGDTLFLVALGSLLVPLQETLILYGTALFVAGISRALIHRQHLSIKSLEYYLVGFLFLVIFGSLPPIALDKTSQDFLLAVGSLLAGIAFFLPLLSFNRFKLDFSKPPQALISSVIVNGFNSVDNMGFLINSFFQDIPWTRYQVIATKAAAQLIPYGLVLLHDGAAVVAMPAIPPELIWMCVAIIPAAALGSFLGGRVLARITDTQFYTATRITLWVMGAIYLGRGVLSLMRLVPQFTTPQHL